MATVFFPVAAPFCIYYGILYYDKFDRQRLACVAGGIRGHKGRSLKYRLPIPHFEFSGSWVTERSDWLEYRFEFMIDRKVLLVFI